MKEFECESSPEFAAYCVDPLIKLHFGAHALWRMRLAALPELFVPSDMGLGLSGPQPPERVIAAVREKLSLEVAGCAEDLACIAGAMQTTSDLLPRLAQPERMAQEEAASQGEPAAPDPIEAEYAAEWEAARAALAPPDDPDHVEPLFLWRFPEPARWSERRRSACNLNADCLAARPPELARLVETREEAVAKAAARERVAAQAREEEERQAARVRADEAAAERARAARVAELSAIDVDALLPPGSQLRPLVSEGFEAFDRKVALPMATRMGDAAARIANVFGAGGMGEGIRSGTIDNRGNLVAAAYGLSRRNAIGYCGDEIVEVYRRTTPGTETRTVGGVVLSRTDGVDVYVKTPRRFAAFVRASNFDGTEDRFADEIRGLGGCDSPLLQHIEDNMVNFAVGGPFVPWPVASAGGDVDGEAAE